MSTTLVILTHEGKIFVLNGNALFVFAGLVYIVFFAIHIIHKRTLEEHIVFSVFFIYIVITISAIFFPFPYQHELIVSRQDEHIPFINIVPFRDMYLMLREGFGGDYIRWWGVLRNNGGNFLLFFPLGFLTPLMMGQIRSGRAFMMGVGVSIVIELLQLFLDVLLGFAYRICDINDVIFNGLGFWIGFLLERWLIARVDLPTFYKGGR